MRKEDIRSTMNLKVIYMLSENPYLILLGYKISLPEVFWYLTIFV